MNEPTETSELNKAKCKVTQGNPQYQYKLGAEWFEGSPVEDRGGRWKIGHEPATCAYRPKSHLYAALW